MSRNRYVTLLYDIPSQMLWSVTNFRKDESDTTAFLVVVNIGSIPDYSETVNFRSVSPMMPKKGHVIITSTLNENTQIEIG